MARICVLLLLGSPAQAAEFLTKRDVTMQEVKADLELALEQALGSGHGQQREGLVEIERRLSTTFKALPKNDLGLLGKPALHHLAHSYFVSEYGWYVNGLELNSVSVTANLTEGASLHKDMVPAFIEQVLEARRSNGFSLQDAVAMVATLERVIFDEGVKLLETAYAVRGLTTNSRYSEEAVGTVLDSYMVLYLMGTDPRETQNHFKEMAGIADVFPPWNDTRVFVRDVLGNTQFAQAHRSNIFANDGYSFYEVWQALDSANHLYGKFQEYECQDMKQALTKRDPEMTGRVTLHGFWRGVLEGGLPFTESTDYLRKLGVLDETDLENRGAQVIIPNYIHSTNNCVVTTAYYEVCCINECDGLMTHLEAKIAAPSAKPEEILALVENLPSSTVEAPRNLSTALTSALGKISEIHGGEVLLHGRLFGQWMHYAFPQECPYPHTSASGVQPVGPDEYTKQTGSDNSVSVEEFKASLKFKPGKAVPMSQWTMDEELRVGQPAMNSGGITAGRLMSWAASAFAVIGFAATIWEAYSRIFCIAGGSSKPKEFLV